MPRIRSIKPEFWTDSKVVKLSMPARLLFIGLWNFCDDEGRMKYDATEIKLRIMPLDDVDVDELTAELRRITLISPYSVDGVDYIEVTGFRKHQKVDKRSKSRIPPPNPPESPRIPTTDQGSRIKEGIKEGIKERKGSGKEERETQATLSADLLKFGFEILGSAAEITLAQWCKLYPEDWIRAAMVSISDRKLTVPAKYIEKILQSYQKNGGPTNGTGKNTSGAYCGAGISGHVPRGGSQADLSQYRGL